MILHFDTGYPGSNLGGTIFLFSDVFSIPHSPVFHEQRQDSAFFAMAPLEVVGGVVEDH
jgi:hypothetical protein